MPLNKLSKTKIDKLTKPGIYSDGAGLYLRVRTGGSKSWHFIWKRDGKRTEIALGPYPGYSTQSVSLELAREKAQEIRDQLARAQYVKGQPAEAPAIEAAKDDRPTFVSLIDDVIEIETVNSRNDKHKTQWGSTLRTHARHLHKMPVADIKRADVLAAIKPIWDTKNVTARRTLWRIAAVLEHAKSKDLFTGDNPAVWENGLNKLLPDIKKAKKHHAALAYEDIPAFIASLRGVSGVAAQTVEFICLTACRAGEAREAIWPEFDLEAAVWTIPASRMKAGKEHRIPLSARAVEILMARQQVATGDLVFEGAAENAAISEQSLLRAIRASSDGKATTHGMRSAFRDWSGDETDHQREIIEHALAHGLNAVEGAYRRSDAFKKRQILMQDWADYCGTAPSKVA